MANIIMAVYNSIQNDARVIRAAEALNKDGHKITVLSCNSDVNYSNPAFKSVVYSYPKKGFRLLLHFWLFVWKWLKTYKKDYDIIYMHDYFMPIIGVFSSKRVKKKWIYDAHELLIQRCKYKKSKRERFFFMLEKFSAPKADLVIAANDERLRIIKKIYKLSNVVSVGNISNLNIEKINNNPEDIIVYQGILNEERRPDLYIKVLKFLPENIKLKLIGGGNIDYYRNLATELELSSRVIFTGKIPYKDLIEESQKCKVGIVSYLMNDLNNLYCSPNKLFEYIQFGLPIIASPQPFLKQIIKDYHVGEIWDCRKDTLEDLAEKILRIINNSDLYREKMAEFNHAYTSEKEMKKLTEAVAAIML